MEIEKKKTDATDSKVIRFIKGMFIGSGFILPGVSGGALAAVFGVYERIISFLAHITKDFKEKLLYLLPIGFGCIAGIILLSFAVSYLLGGYEAQILWLFIGCIIGTVPALWRQAGSHGRNKKHIIITIASFALGLLFLAYGQTLIKGAVPINFGTWILAGAIVGLGIIVPGMSPSNFLVYMGMYKPMTDGIKELNMGVVIPLAIGAILCVLLFSKIMDYIFRHAHAGMFHFIIGIVLASTIMIIPRNYNYLSIGTIVCVLLFVGGIALGLWMGRLEDKYKTPVKTEESS